MLKIVSLGKWYNSSVASKLNHCKIRKTEIVYFPYSIKSKLLTIRWTKDNI